MLAINFGVANNSDKNLNSYVIQKYNNNLKINNDNDTYVTHAFLNNLLKCNQPNSFFNFFNYSSDSTCSNDLADYKINDDINFFKRTDATRFNYINSILALLTSYEKYISQSCSIDQVDLNSCILKGRTTNIIKPFLKNISIQKDALGNNNIQIFDTNTCNALKASYSIYHVYGSISIPIFQRLEEFIVKS